MSLAVRRISLVNDRQEMLQLLNRNFGGSQEARFDWRHRDNPAGPSWSWFVYDRNNLATVAMATVFPRHMFVRGKRVLGGQVGQFAVDASHRSLGPAVLLQRTTFEPVDMGALAFCYDCPPHDAGMSTFVRLGMRANCEVTRYALPLRSDEYFERRLGKSRWTKPVVSATNLGLKLRSFKKRMPGIEIGKLEGTFGEEFSHLDTSIPSSNEIRASRAAEDLNWRYRGDPLARNYLPNGNTGGYRLWAARRAGELLAFVAFFIQTDGIASIVDIFGRELSDVGPALLEEVIAGCRREGVSSIHGFCSDESELKAVFRSIGFKPRELVARVVAYEKSQNGSGALLNSGVRWVFSQVEVML
jgi:hypothetical protein